jgi:4-alpha-glucanotransferase
MHHHRRSGILLHPTSLPGPGGIGSLGEDARAFVDFLHAAGQSLWQILPLGPPASGNSPYSCFSAFAGNPLLISLETLADEGDLAPDELDCPLSGERIDFPAVDAFKFDRLRRAAARFFAGNGQGRMEEFWHFCDTTPWLHDYALFMALKEQFGGKVWSSWPAGIVRREPDQVEECSCRLGPAIGELKYLQWQFHRQWGKLRRYANERGVCIVGDIPIFVAHDSADVWANRDLFLLDGNGAPLVVAGVPPDYFSATGQLWGNPLYNWQVSADTGHRWWIERFRWAFAQCDTLRIDHFRGFESHWEVPAGEKTAVNGRWVAGPGEGLFNALRDALGELSIIAEDLGVITPEVEALRDRCGFPGMKILQFAFGSGPGNPYLPHNHVSNCVVYTGTHDNDTSAGWLAGRAGGEMRHLQQYLPQVAAGGAWELVRAVQASVADSAIVPLQDLLGLGSEARMNLPGTPSGNWGWRCPPGALTEQAAQKMREVSVLYGRVSN